MEKAKQAARRKRGEGCVYKRPNGKYCATVEKGRGTDGKRVREFIYGSSEKEVLKELRRIHRDRDMGVTESIRDSRTLSEFCKQWLADVVVLQLTKGSQIELERTFRNHIEPFIGQAKLDRFDTEDVDTLFKELRKNKRAPRTLKKVYNFLNAAFKRAMRTGKITENPLRHFDCPKYAPKEFSPLSRDEVERFLVECVGNEYEALYVIALLTGMRQGEIFALTWRNIDFNSRTISVRHSMSYVECEVTLKDPKNRSSKRTILLADAVIDALAAHRERMAENFGSLPQFVFVNEKGAPLRPETLRRAFKLVLAAAKVPISTRFHDLRHTFATLLLSENIHPKVVMEMLGHTRIGTTMDLYSHTLPTMQKGAISALNKLGKSDDSNSVRQ